MNNHQTLQACCGEVAMGRIAAIEYTFNHIINNCYRVLPCLDKKDIAVKHMRNLVNEAVTTYSIQQCYFVDAVGMVLETLESGYQLICYYNNTTAQQALVAQSKLARHPLRKTLKSVVKKLQFAGVAHEQ